MIAVLPIVAVITTAYAARTAFRCLRALPEIRRARANPEYWAQIEERYR